jgi:hypothetical protein
MLLGSQEPVEILAEWIGRISRAKAGVTIWRHSPGARSVTAIANLVDIHEIGASAEAGELDFSTDEDGCNHVVSDGSGCRVLALPLDEVFVARTPILLKIDVEGFEMNVIKGAQRLLKDSALKAVLMEMNGLGKRYGFDDRALDTEMEKFGFNSFLYEPWSRKLSFSDPNYVLNTIYP